MHDSHKLHDCPYLCDKACGTSTNRSLDRGRSLLSRRWQGSSLRIPITYRYKSNASSKPAGTTTSDYDSSHELLDASPASSGL